MDCGLNTPECSLSTECPQDKACSGNKGMCINPCERACATNAVCTVADHVPKCECPSGMTGNAYIRCYSIHHDETSECILHADCPSNKLCWHFKCIDPCPGTCGLNASCEVKNHETICKCLPGFIGNAFDACIP